MEVKQVTRWFWILGVSATLVGATLTVLGFMLQKYSLQLSKRAGPLGAGYWLEWRWMLGITIWLAGQGMCLLGDGLASRSVLACFNCWNIVVVFGLARPCFGEVIDRKAGVGALVTVAGCIWVILAGPRTYYEQTVDTINSSWHSMYLLYIAGATAVYLVAVGIIARYRASLAQSPPVECAAVSASFAWYAQLLSKCAATLTVTSVHSENQMGHWEYWAFLAGMVGCAVCQIHTLNMGLKSGRTVDVLPTYEAFSMTGQIIICGIFFGEFRGLGVGRMLTFAGGVLCVLAGVVALVRFGAETKDKAEDTPLRPGRASGAAPS